MEFCLNRVLAVDMSERPHPTRSSTNSISRNLVSLASVTSAQGHPEPACSSTSVEIVPAVVCGIPAALKSGGGGVTLFVLLLALLPLFCGSAVTVASSHHSKATKCLQRLSRCVSTFRNDHNTPRTSGCSLAYLCAFPCLCPCPSSP